MLINIIIGIIIVAIGALMTIKTDKVIEITGPIEWAETKFGGTRNFYKISGVVLIFLGFMLATGILGDFFAGFFGRFNKY